MTKRFIVILGLAFVGAIILFMDSCRRVGSSRARSAASHRSVDSGRKDSHALVKAVTTELNNLPTAVVLELKPPFPILDDSKSADGQPVLAICSVTPGVTGSPYNYLSVPKGNAQFDTLGVRAGDQVRYFVNYTQEDPEYGVQQLTHIELPVRRLDTENRQNGLILDAGLSGPMPIPSRIEIWRFSDKRMIELSKRIKHYLSSPKQFIGWEPSPDESALVLLRDRLNQWLRNASSDTVSWQPEPLVSQLSPNLQEAKRLRESLTPKGQETGLFEPTDPRQLQQAIWSRDIARWAKGDGHTDLQVAAALFDWTVRNIQLDPPEGSGIVHQPWQALMYGHGTAAQRAWVFAELCRQRQLDVVMLVVKTEESSAGRWWLPALWSEGHLYLFDSQLGMPIPGEQPDSVATLSDLVSTPELLKQLDLDEDHTYPILADNLQQIEAQLISSPLQISRRAALLQQKLDGDGFAVLSADNRRVAAELKECPNLKSIRLWPQPYQAILDERAMTQKQRQQAAMRFVTFAQRPRLWKARVLHFQGTKEIPISQQNNPLAQPDLGHKNATTLYLDPRIRPPKAILEKIEPSKRVLYNRVKVDASYWLGLLRYDLGDYEIAAHWLQERTLQSEPFGPWTTGARYNLARTYESMGQLEAAVKLLAHDDSPQSYGNKIRAERLQQELNTKSE